MLPVFAGACTEAELVLVVDGADQFPKRDFAAGGAAGCVVVVEPVEAVPVRVLDMPGKADGVTVVVPTEAPNIEGVLVKEAVGAGLVVVMEEGCTKPEPSVAAPKMGLKVWTAGLLSCVGVSEEAAVTAKMGLKVLLTEMLAGAAAAAEAEAVFGLEAEEEGAVLF